MGNESGGSGAYVGTQSAGQLPPGPGRSHQTWVHTVAARVRRTLYAVRVTTCGGEDKGKAVWKSCGYVWKRHATRYLPNVRLDNSLGGLLCLNIALFGQFYLLTL